MLPDDYYSIYLSDRTNLLLRRLYINIERGRLYSTRYLLDNTNLKLTGDKGRFALYLVVKIPTVKMRAKHTLFKWLLDAGCDCNHVDDKGMSVLLWLLGISELELAKILLNNRKMDIDYTFKDKNNNSSLMYAVRTKNFEMVTLLTDILLTFGVELDVRNTKGYTPYAEAINLKLNDIAQFLVQTGKISVNIMVPPIESKLKRKCKTINFSQMRINLSRGQQQQLVNSSVIPSKSAKSCSPTLSENDEVFDSSNEFTYNNKNNDKPRMKIYADYTHPKKPPSPDHSTKPGRMDTTPSPPSQFQLDEATGMIVPLGSLTQPTPTNEIKQHDNNKTNSNNTLNPNNEHNASKLRKISSRNNKLEVLIEKGEEKEEEKRTTAPKSPDPNDGRTSKLDGPRRYSESGKRFRNLASVMALAKNTLKVYQTPIPPPKPLAYITYADVRQMMPGIAPVNPNRTSTDELKWLMLLQSDQKTGSFNRGRSEVIADIEEKKTKELLAQRKMEDHVVLGLKREKKRSVFIGHRKPPSEGVAHCNTVGHKHGVDT